MKRWVWLILLLLPLLGRAEVTRLRVEGPIDSIAEEYVLATLQHPAEGVTLVILELDTPGGYDTSMRAIIKAMLASPVPVAVLVTPRGARAASAGFFLAMAADIAAMAPGTNMGAAHPVSATGGEMDKVMQEKVTNDAVSYIRSVAERRGRNVELAEKAVRESRSFTAEECRQNNLIDCIAADAGELLRQIEGRTVTLADGRQIVLRLGGQSVRFQPMSARQRFLRTITNPSLAYFLLIFGLIGLYIEFTHPGTVIPGVLGAICLLLAFLAFQILPINYIGLLLILLSGGLFIAEIKVQGFGFLGVGGIVAFVLGSIILIRSPIPELRPAMSIIITISICFAAIFLFLTYKALQAMQGRVATGEEGLIGESGVVKVAVDAAGGKVFVHGEWWNAVSDEPLPVGTRVTVTEVHDLVVKVKQSGG